MESPWIFTNFFTSHSGNTGLLVTHSHRVYSASVWLVAFHFMPTHENTQHFHWIEFWVRFFRKFLDHMFHLCCTLSICLRRIKMSMENTHVPWRHLRALKRWSTTRTEYTEGQSSQRFVVHPFLLVLTPSQASWGHSGSEGLLCYGGCHLDDEVSNFPVPYEIPRSEWLDEHNMASKSESQDDYDYSCSLLWWLPAGLLFLEPLEDRFSYKVIIISFLLNGTSSFL